MNCCYCGRTTSEITGQIVNKDKVTPHTVIEVFYKDSKRKLVCARCVSTYTPVLANRGEAVLTYRPKVNEYTEDHKALKNIDLIPLPEEEMVTFL